MIWLRNVLSLSALLIRSPTASAHRTVILVLQQDAWNTVLGNMRHVQDIRQNFVASTMANSSCYDFNYHLGMVGMHQHWNFSDFEFNSDCSWPNGMLIIFQIVSLLCKMFGPLKHSAITWNISLLDLHNFWHTRRQLPFTTATFFLYTLHTHNCFLLGQEINKLGTILRLQVSAVVHYCDTKQPIHEIIECTICETFNVLLLREIF
jgi:hypothetical protein